MTSTLFVMLLAIGGPPPSTVANRIEPPTVSETIKSPSQDSPVEKCFIELIDTVQLPGGEPGALMALEAKEGMQVPAGMNLGHIDDREAQAQLKMKKAEMKAADEQAESNVNVDHAQAAASAAEFAYKRALEANEKHAKAVSAVEVMRLWYEWEKSKFSIQQAKVDKRVAGFTALTKAAEVEAVEVNIMRRQLISPLDGVVTKVNRHVGEWVAPGDPVIEIVSIGTVKAFCKLKASEYNPHEIDGRPVTVEVELAHGRKEKFTGKVVFVSPLVELGGQFNIVADVKNRKAGDQWVLRGGGGMPATMTVHLK